MPLYAYRCPCGADALELRKYAERDDPLPCQQCNTAMVRVMSAHYRQPDGIYSYDPNLGSPEKFERNLVGAKANREKVLNRLDKGHGHAARR